MFRMRPLTGARALALCAALATPFASTPADAQEGAAEAGPTPEEGTSAAAQGLAAEAQLVAGEESEALMALRLAEEAMFREQQHQYRPETAEAVLEVVPDVMTSDAPEPRPETATSAGDLSWLQGVTLPDLPIRWDERVVRYLEFFRNDRRGRRLMSGWIRRSTRYGQMIDRALAGAELPRDLRCVAMAESGFDPTVRSYAGAAGMWQFVPRTGEQYGLHQTHWVDQRMDPIRSTHAAAQYLKNLHDRLGAWELALAAYNMGYGALLRSIRKFNTNDFWVLARLESGLPFETTVYVSKILACSVVMRNPERFGFGELVRDPPIEIRELQVGGGIAVGRIARAAGLSVAEFRALNPELLRGRTPPGEPYAVRIPAERADAFVRAWARVRPSDRTYRAYTVRFGESLEDVAWAHRTSISNLRDLNELEDDVRVTAGTAIMVPAVRVRTRRRDSEQPTVVSVPQGQQQVEGRRRVFYRVRSRRERPAEIARFFGVTADELRAWNDLDPSARLVSGMILQLFVQPDQDLSNVVVLSPDDVRVLVVGTEEFFDFHEQQQGRVRFRYTVQPGESLSDLAERFGRRSGDLARINRFSRRTRLQPGQVIIVYADAARVPESLRPRPEAEPEPPAEAPESDDAEGTSEPAAE